MGSLFCFLSLERLVPLRLVERDLLFVLFPVLVVVIVVVDGWVDPSLGEFLLEDLRASLLEDRRLLRRTLVPLLLLVVVVLVLALALLRLVAPLLLEVSILLACLLACSLRALSLLFYFFCVASCLVNGEC